MAIDYTTATGRVRLLIPDTDESAEIFTDDQIAAFLALADGDTSSTSTAIVKRAAAHAITALATDQAMLLKVVSVNGTANASTDGAKLSAELRARAKQLREEADAGGDFAIAEQVHTPFAARERRFGQALRGL